MSAPPPDSIFKANDIRGIYGETLSEDGIRQIGIALAAAVRANGGKIAIARDGRQSSPALSRALAAGLQSGGVNVLDIGIAPTPALYFAAHEMAGGNGAMITGSHNPPAHNGIKMLFGGETFGGARVRELMKTAHSSPAEGEMQTADIRDNYIAAVQKATGDSRPLHLVADAGNGAAGEFAPELYRRLGHFITPLFCEIDGAFPNHHPDPAQPENLVFARAAMQKTGADAAFVFDGDGDRLGVILPDEEDWVFPDRILMLLARDMLVRNPGARVVFDVKCTARLAPWIEKHGGIADMQPTGHAFIKARMRETGALLGGEMSGHFYFAENWRGFDDGLLAGAKLAKILAETKSPFADVPRSIASPEIVKDIGNRNGREIVAQIAAAANFDGAQLCMLDGIRADYPDGFGLVRASNTTASLVLRFEGENRTALERIRGQFQAALAAADLQL